MQRFGEGVSQFDFEKLEKFVQELNRLNWRLSRHGVERLTERAENLLRIAEAIKQTKLDKKNCFEYYLNEGNGIEKAGFIIEFEGKFLKVFVDNGKRILSVWVNEKRDKNLNAEKYVQGGN